jgi:hypothetical protein
MGDASIVSPHIRLMRKGIAVTPERARLRISLSRFIRRLTVELSAARADV